MHIYMQSKPFETFSKEDVRKRISKNNKNFIKEAFGKEFKLIE